MHFGTSKLLSDFLGGGGHLPNSGSLFFPPWISSPQILQLLFVCFSNFGSYFPPVSNCIISACHFHILLLSINLLKLLPFLCGAFALCLCFDLMFDILKQWDAASCSWSLIFVICYCDLALLHFEMGKIKCFSILFLLPLWSNCVVTISIKYIWQNHLMHCGFYSQKIWQTYLECICIFFFL